MLDGKKIKTGLIGRKLGHSFSPQIHSFLADYEYKLYEMEENEVGNFLKNCPLDALNVTIPYKKTVLPFLSYISPTAKKIGSVNTIVKKNDGLYGYNTDYYGFLYMLEKSKIQVKNKKCLILGSGGASLTVKAVLKDMNAKEITVISRSGENNYENIHLHADADVLVNTTPVGMFPDTTNSPVDINIFNNLTGVLDLIYNPNQTKLLHEAEKKGIKTINGLSMLVAQGKKACELFLSDTFTENPIDEITSIIEKQLKNIVLIGMPGCGKSTAGKKLAEKLNKAFIDTDTIITDNSGMSIPDIFTKYSEEKFRELEHAAAVEAGKSCGSVIATGGGIVTREANYFPLHSNSYIIWLKRDLSLLPINGRPISQNNDINELYKKRAPLYESFCDAIVDVSENPDETAEKIINIIGSM